MYKQFSHTTSLHTSERLIKKNKLDILNKLNINPKFKRENKYMIENYDSLDLFDEIYKKNKRKNWLPSIKRKPYFSYVPFLISEKTSIDYITNTKCCSPFHVYMKKGNFLYK